MSKENLSKLQSAFITELLARSGESILNSTESFFAPVEHLTIYKNNQMIGLTKALMETFHVCYKLVGRRSFEFIARHYIREHPSFTRNLNEYGATFSEFILNFEPAKELIYLSDVAKLEWNIHEVIIGSDDPEFCWQDLSSIPEHQQGSICFYRSDTSRLQASLYPIDLIFATNQSDYTGETLVELNDPVFLYIGREDYDLKMQRLTEIEWKLLSILNKDHSLAELALENLIIENEIDLSSLLPSLIQRGCISGFVIPA